MAEAAHSPDHVDAWPTWPSAPGGFALGAPARLARWDLLLVCVSIHIANYIGRVPQLFPGLVLVYFAVTVLYVAVVLSRFQLSPDNWRLGDLYYYDANDLATLIVSAMPCGLYFVLGQRRPLVRLCAALGLVVLAVGLTRSGSRGGFLAFLAVVGFILLGFTTLRARSRVVGLVVVLTVVLATASDRYWAQMQ